MYMLCQYAQIWIGKVLRNEGRRLTVGVSGGWADLDPAWEQEKLEARKMLVNRADSHTSGAPPHDRSHHVSPKKQGRNGSILQMADT